MTATAHPQAVTGDGVVRVLRAGDEVALQRLLDTDPVRHCFAASRVALGGLDRIDLGGQIWGYESAGRLHSALLVGANIVPIETDADSRAAFAEYAIRQGRHSSSIVGPAHEVLGLWAELEVSWGPARDVRMDQPLMVAREPARVTPDPQVRRSTPEELEVIFPACVAMFTEEVGVSPLAGGAGPAYRRRVADLIRTGRSFARFDEGRPIFKAEVGALSAAACQIQGVWVDPSRRGTGLASAGMASVVALARELAVEVSLYVNEYNVPAIRAYRAAGFVQVGTFATVLI